MTAPLVSKPLIPISSQIEGDDRLPPQHHGQDRLPDGSVKINFFGKPVQRRRTHTTRAWRTGNKTTEVAEKIIKNYYVLRNVANLPVVSSASGTSFRKATHLGRLPKMELAQTAIKAFLKNEPPAQKMRAMPVLETLSKETRFFEQLEDLCKKMITAERVHNWLDDDASRQLDAWFISDILGQGTRLPMLEDYIAKFGISLDCIRCHSSGELKEVLIELEQSETILLQQTVFLSCYRLFNLLSGLQACFMCKRANTPSSEKSMQPLLECTNHLKDSVIVIAHSAMKEEMPFYFSDTLYTALVFVEGGKVVFHPDNLQPRGGWKDIPILQKLEKQKKKTATAAFSVADSTVSF